MAIKVGSQDAYFRIKSAAALKAAGVRLKNSDMEQKGREDYAEAVIENTILAYTDDLTAAARENLARILFDAARSTTADAEEDATADAEETTKEILQLRSAKTPFDLVRPSELPPETLYDPDDEFEEDEEDYVDED